MSDCHLHVVIPENTSELVTNTNLALETSPAPYNPTLSYPNNAEMTHAGAVWRWIGWKNTDPTTDAPYTSVGIYPGIRSGDKYWAEADKSISFRTNVHAYTANREFQVDEICHDYDGTVFRRFISLIDKNKGNALPAGTGDNLSWEYLDDIREFYTYLPKYENRAWGAGSLCYQLGANYYPIVYIALLDVPQDLANPDFVKPNTATRTDISESEQFYEFVRLTNPLNIYDVDPQTQSQADEIVEITAVSRTKAISDIILLNVHAVDVDVTSTNTDDDTVLLSHNASLVNKITRLAHFRQSRFYESEVHIRDVPFAINMKHEISINKSSGTAKIGGIIIGQSYDLGELQFGLSGKSITSENLIKTNFDLIGVSQGIKRMDFDFETRISPARANTIVEKLKKEAGKYIYFTLPTIVNSMGKLCLLKTADIVARNSEYYTVAIYAQGIDYV